MTTLQTIQSQWLKEFKQDLFEDINLNNQTEVKDFLELIINVHLPIWIEEATKNKDFELVVVHENYIEQIKNLITNM